MTSLARTRQEAGRLKSAATWLGVLFLLWAPGAHAAPPVELGGYLGGAFPVGAGLGNPYFADQQPRNSVALGLRAGWWFLPALSGELAFDYTPTSTRGALTAGRPGIGATLLGLHASGRYTLWPARRLRPFAVAGASVLGYLASAPSHYALQSPDLDVGAHWGLGLESTIPVPMVRTVRLDLRHILVPGQDRTYSVFGLNLGATFDLFGEVQALQQTAGAATRPAPRTPVQTSPVTVNLPVPTSPTPAAAREVDRQRLAEDVRFGLDEAVLSAEDRSRLDRLALQMNETPVLRLEIAGHSDRSGAELRNTRLSRERADAVKWYLVDQGVDAERIVTVGRGPAHPIDTNETAEGRARNRRAELTLLVPSPMP